MKIKLVLSVLALFLSLQSLAQRTISQDISYKVVEVYAPIIPEAKKTVIQQRPERARDNTSSQTVEVVYFPDEDPSFPGGIERLAVDFTSKLKSESEILNGKLIATIEISFLTDSKGKISDYKVVSSDIPAWNEELEKSILSEKWYPGMYNSRYHDVLCSYTFLFSSREPLFLVPYNDNGMWTWADTLGNIKNESRFYDVTPFYLRNDGKGYVANVVTELGENKFQYGEGLILPNDIGIIDHLEHLNLKMGSFPDLEYFITKDKEQRKGLYHFSGEKFVLEHEYEEILIEANDRRHSIILTKRFGAETYEKFFMEDQRFEQTTVIDAWEVTRYGKRVFVLKNQDGSHSYLNYGQIQPISDWESFKREHTKEPVYPKVTDKKPIKVDKKTSAKQENGIVKTVDYSDWGTWVQEKYGFSKLMIIRKRNKLGVRTDTGKKVLPYAYDEIEFADNETLLLLEKDGKMGCRIIFTDYKTIPAKYESLKVSQAIQVTKGWNFALFEITLKGQKGFVGENGVEYFDFSKITPKE